MCSGFNHLALSGHIRQKMLLLSKQHHLCRTTNMPMVPTPCRAALFLDLTVNLTCFMVLGATAWSTTVKGMDFLMPNILRIWALAPIHPEERFGMPTLSDFHLAR